MTSLPTTTPTVVLLPSPLLGPAVWAPVAQRLRAHAPVVVASPPARARTPDDVLAAFTGVLAAVEGDAILVPHSNAGVYVPALLASCAARSVVFVDAVLPPPEGPQPLAPPEMLDLLGGLADRDGLLPGWTQWWDAADVASLFPDDATRHRVEREQRRLPYTYFEAVLDAPRGWDRRRCAYLAFGDTYGPERDEASRRGWPVRALAGEHLHMLVDPAAVADTILALSAAG